ncbi:MAG: hypothetical protein HY903_05385 [Deltaproteobacteria bacterium]|nr:hypothetical protein [Deltaproteobacteria bacterium]
MVRHLPLLVAAALAPVAACRGARVDGGASPEGSAAPSASAAGALPAALIVGGVSAQRLTLLPCVQAARAAGEPGSDLYDLRLSFTVSPDGAVSRIDVQRPAGVLTGAFRDCVVAAMGRWRFMSSESGGQGTAVPVSIAASDVQAGAPGARP